MCNTLRSISFHSYMSAVLNTCYFTYICILTHQYNNVEYSYLYQLLLLCVYMNCCCLFCEAGWYVDHIHYHSYDMHRLLTCDLLSETIYICTGVCMHYHDSPNQCENTMKQYLFIKNHSYSFLVLVSFNSEISHLQRLFS